MGCQFASRRMLFAPQVFVSRYRVGFIYRLIEVREPSRFIRVPFFTLYRVLSNLGEKRPNKNGTRQVIFSALTQSRFYVRVYLKMQTNSDESCVKPHGYRAKTKAFWPCGHNVK